MKLKKFNLFLLLFLFLTPVKSQELKILENTNKYNFYAGTFDLIDKEGDDKTSLFGLEHKNSSLFKDTFLGKFSPLTGAFMTGKNAIYLYTGVQAEYALGQLFVNNHYIY